MTAIPILFLSDSPDINSGLSRISSNIAQICVAMPEFRVAFLGRGGTGSCKLPFMQYNFPESAQWGEDYIERAWMDHAGQQKGIIFTVWDATRLHWFGAPHGLPDSALRQFLTSGRFRRWGYFPVDGNGIQGGLGGLSREALAGYDRLLAYGIYGQKVLERAGVRSIEWLPHGVNTGRFQPRGRAAGRAMMKLDPEEAVLGACMTNQARKDWGLAFQIMKLLARDAKRRWRFWCHVDVLERHWSIPALVDDFDLADRVVITAGNWMRDYEMSFWYSGCDVTMLPSLGEGFGYSLVESMACGVPVIHGNYAGGVELVPRREWLIEPAMYRVDGLHALLRPVYKPEDWASRITIAYEESECNGEDATAAECVRSTAHLGWDKLRPSWQKWLREGL